MANRNLKDNQANQYDKIFRENMEAALPGVVEHVLGLNIVRFEDLPNEIQHTKERKPDLLKKVTDASGKIFILHIEYQVVNENEMVYRMAEYCIMLLRKYALPVEQFVLFMGNGKASMATGIDHERIKFSYQLIRLAEMDYKIFLNSDKPEEQILAILGNFDNDGEEVALHNILKNVQENAAGDLAENRYFKQLRILAQLRKLEIKFTEAMESITKYFKEEKDPLFIRGEARGEVRGEERGKAYGEAIGEARGKAEGKHETATAIAREMKKQSFPFKQIAGFTGLSIEEIEKL